MPSLKRLFLSPVALARENVASRLSLAGTQSKTGLAHSPDTPLDTGWLRPLGLAASTHILKGSHLRDMPEIEFLCMKAAQACGIETARASLLDLGNPVLAVRRFDRQVSSKNGQLMVRRLHQEDLAQTLGVSPASKYAELGRGTVQTIANLIRATSSRPSRDLSHFAKMLVFAYVIGDCDAHLKNYSLTRHEGIQRLAPAYDLVSTTRHPRFSRDMAMALGGERNIDAVSPATFGTMSRNLGMGRGMLAKLAIPIVENVTHAIREAGDGAFGPVLESTPYIADDFIDDIAERVMVVQAFCRGGS